MCRETVARRPHRFAHGIRYLAWNCYNSHCHGDSAPCTRLRLAARFEFLHRLTLGRMSVAVLSAFRDQTLKAGRKPFQVMQRPLTEENGSALLSLVILHTHIPGPPLSDFVELIWFGDDYTAPHALERVLPTGDMSLIVNLYEDRTRIYNPDDLRKCQTLPA